MKQNEMPKTTWIKNPKAVLSSFDCGGGIVISDSIITELLCSGDRPKKKVDVVFDASDLVVLPGLVNTHHHFYQTLTRAFKGALNKSLFHWLKSLYPVWAKLEPEDINIATQLALAELLLSGCTTTADHHYLFPKGAEDAIDAQVVASRELGMRVTLTRGSMSLGEDQGGLPPSEVLQNEEAILCDSARVASEYHDPGPGSFLQIALAPCSPFSVTTELMKETSLLADKLGLRMHTHLAETKDEIDFFAQKFNTAPLDYLEDLGWLNDQVWIAHGIHFADEEILRLGKNRVGISHCPSSNMILGSGICPASNLEEVGCPLGIGVDGSASNDCSNMIQELRMAFLLQRSKYGAQNLSHLDVFRWGTKGSATCLGRNDIGEIAIGRQADLAFFELSELRFSGANDPLAALLLSGAHKAKHVMIGGNWRVIDGQICDLDIQDLMYRHRNSAEQLLLRAGY
tara:strand:- start:1581 stop:2951 length:1371 start_codon:yes stop_codon:yes gene_type:complete